MKQKNVLAKVRVVKGKENEYLSLVSPLIEAAKTEPGNLSYNVYRNVENPSEFIVYEEYINDEAFSAHCNTPAFHDFVQQVKPLLDGEIDIRQF